MSKAALTIVSRNYLALARVLAKSFLTHHPNDHFYVYLCDTHEGIDPSKEPFTFLYAEDISIPQRSIFFTQYSILEANTAVKPFVLEYLLFDKGYDKVVYLDPDIQIFNPLTEAWNALEDNNIVLTPHVLKPYSDNCQPTELNILQSGTYNLGFIALHRADVLREMLRWWQKKLFRECLVDIPRGLFVDQKWMDLAVGYFEKVRILRNPGYNVAYWNLHERKITLNKNVPHVEGIPLSFFHFSGYSPFRPGRLSKHQDRHALSDLPEVKQLCDNYGAQLLAEGHMELSDIPYGFDILPNGVKISACVRRALRLLLDRNVTVPSPWENPDEFVRKLMVVDETSCGRHMAPLQLGVLMERPDVSNAYPDAWRNPFDPSFLEWVHTSGRGEMDLGRALDICPNFIDGDLIGEVFESLDRERRVDVYKAYAGMWFSEKKYKKFCGWVLDYGTKELNFTKEHAKALEDAQSGILHVLGIYLLSDELQSKYPHIYNADDLKKFRCWLAGNAMRFNLNLNKISLFEIFSRQNSYYLQCVIEIYGTISRKKFGHPLNAMSILESFGTLQGHKNNKKILDWLLKTTDIPAVDQLQAFFSTNGFDATTRRSPFGAKILRDLVEGAEETVGDKLTESLAQSLFTFIRRGIKEAEEAPANTINIAGFFNAPSGMGYSAYSMLKTVQHSSWATREFTLPTHYDDAVLSSENPTVFGWPSSMAAVTVTVANADTANWARNYCPATYWAPVNVGYWVWETENFPEKFASSARHFDAILTPSQHSANAIAAKIDIPVYVLPHVVDIEEFNQIEGRREDHGLPPDVLLFGYFFDLRSSLERKNPLGAIRAFRAAFGASSDVLFLLKVNGCDQYDFDYELFKSELRNLNNVLLVEGTYSRERTLELMSCLDVYVSLHRAEGFGLTCAEAMAMGKPVIATDYSGNRDFMDSKCACMVPAKVVTTDRTYGAYPRGSRWADSDIDAAAKYMKMLTDLETRNVLGRNAKQAIRKKLSSSVVGRRLEESLKLLDPKFLREV